MKINVTVTRSREWITAESIRRGENVPDSIMCPVDVAELRESTRAGLYSMANWVGGGFADVAAIPFNSSFEPSPSSYGREYVLIDSDSPTVGEIDDAIGEAFGRIAERKRAYDAEQAAQAAAYRTALHARALLAGEFATLNDRIAGLKSASEGYKHDRAVLAEFLASFPADALRGALKAYATDGIEEARQAIEDASPVTIFEDDE